jgi:hypothetical protein
MVFEMESPKRIAPPVPMELRMYLADSVTASEGEFLETMETACRLR